MSITEVYYKTRRHFFPDLPQWLDAVADPRDPERIRYSVRAVLGSALGLFTCKEGSRCQFNEDRAEGEFAKNLAGLFHLDGVAHGDTIVYFFEESDPEVVAAIHQVRVRCAGHLIRQRVLDPYRLVDRYYLLAFDGTGVITFGEKHCEACLTRKLSNGSTLYYHPVLEAKIVCGNGLVISVGTEFIENTAGESKQDCELKAFYRLARRIKKDFPRLEFCMLGDGIYAGEPTFRLCEELNWRYLIVRQDDDLATVWQEVRSLRPLNTAHRLWRYILVEGEKRRETYRWTEDISYHGGTVHVLEYWKPLDDQQTSHWAWITNLRLPENRVPEIVHLGGRQRWKLENQGFNIQKNHGYALEHIYSHTTQVQKCFYILMQIAHLLNQLVELGTLLKTGLTRRTWSLKGLNKSLSAEIKEKVIPWPDWQAGFDNGFQIRLNDSS